VESLHPKGSKSEDQTLVAGTPIGAKSTGVLSVASTGGTIADEGQDMGSLLVPLILFDEFFFVPTVVS